MALSQVFDRHTNVQGPFKKEVIFFENITTSVAAVGTFLQNPLYVNICPIDGLASSIEVVSINADGKTMDCSDLSTAPGTYVLTIWGF